MCQLPRAFSSVPVSLLGQDTNSVCSPHSFLVFEVHTQCALGAEPGSLRSRCRLLQPWWSLPKHCMLLGPTRMVLDLSLWCGACLCMCCRRPMDILHSSCSCTPCKHSYKDGDLVCMGVCTIAVTICYMEKQPTILLCILGKQHNVQRLPQSKLQQCAMLKQQQCCFAEQHRPYT